MDERTGWNLSVFIWECLHTVSSDTNDVKNDPEGRPQTGNRCQLIDVVEC
jgi:hypothetical protein